MTRPLPPSTQTMIFPRNQPQVAPRDSGASQGHVHIRARPLKGTSTKGPPGDDDSDDDEKPKDPEEPKENPCAGQQARKEIERLEAKVEDLEQEEKAIGSEIDRMLEEIKSAKQALAACQRGNT